MSLSLQEHHVQFFTAVCKDWLPLLQDDDAKRLIVEALKFRIAKGRFKICAFVIMPNHIHLIWRITANFKREDIQRDFLKFTARELATYLTQRHAALYHKLITNAADRSTQVWKRDSMSIDLYSDNFFQQKLNYIHANPCQPKWMLVQHPYDYIYSSASFYETGYDCFNILTHYADI